jgi:hypothetical protein
MGGDYCDLVDVVAIAVETTGLDAPRVLPTAVGLLFLDGALRGR